jgi:hypothetical protein
MVLTLSKASLQALGEGASGLLPASRLVSQLAIAAS